MEASQLLRQRSANVICWRQSGPVEAAEHRTVFLKRRDKAHYRLIVRVGTVLASLRGKKRNAVPGKPTEASTRAPVLLERMQCSPTRFALAPIED